MSCLHLDDSELKICELAGREMSEEASMDEDTENKYVELMRRLLADLSLNELLGLASVIGAAVACYSVDDVTGEFSFRDLAQRTGMDSRLSEGTLRMLENDVKKSFDEE